MKLRRPKTAIAVVLGIAGAAWVIVAARDDEPYYQGKRLSEWLELAEGSRRDAGAREIKQAEHAIRCIGTDALPVLLKWLDYELRPWSVKLYENTPARLQSNPKVYQLILGRGLQRVQSVATAFRVLGTNAASLIPELEARMNNPKDEERALRATIALAEIGIQAFPALTNAMANPNHPFRGLIADRLCYMAAIAEAEDTNFFLPVLGQMLTDPDSNVRILATNAVRVITSESISNAPAL